MSKEKLNAAIDTITDENWSFLKVWSKTYRGVMQPEHLTRGEATFLKLVGCIASGKAMSFIVRQWAGEDGERKFKEALTLENGNS